MADVKSGTQGTNGQVENGHAAGTDATDKSQYTLPSAKTLIEVGDLPIKDENGKESLFKSLYENQPGRQLIVFIRHFYCGVSLSITNIHI